MRDANPKGLGERDSFSGRETQRPYDVGLMGYLEAEYPSPKKVNVLKHSRIIYISPKRLKFTYSAPRAIVGLGGKEPSCGVSDLTCKVGDGDRKGSRNRV